VASEWRARRTIKHQLRGWQRWPTIEAPCSPFTRHSPRCCTHRASITSTTGHEAEEEADDGGDEEDEEEERATAEYHLRNRTIIFGTMD
jgi:hypothetical protein